MDKIEIIFFMICILGPLDGKFAKKFNDVKAISCQP